MKTGEDKSSVMEWLDNLTEDKFDEKWDLDQKIALLDLMIDNYRRISKKDAEALEDARGTLLAEKYLLMEDDDEEE